MSLKSTVEEMRQLLHAISEDLAKAVDGNKAAAQRVRVTTIDLEKTSKKYRKESIVSERSDKTKGAKAKVKQPGKSQPKAQVSKGKAPARVAVAAKRPTAKLSGKR